METTEENSKEYKTHFQDSIDMSLFYMQCNRGVLLNEIKKAVSDTVSVITFLGEAGSGKTMQCRMVEKVMSRQCRVVFYVSAVQSFEDVIRPVAMKMGIDIGSEIKREEIQDLLISIRDQLSSNNEKLLVIFDEAHEIFLATLERIRKMLDVLNEHHHTFQVLFSGEKILQENLKQLSLCSFEGATERTFTLQPLNEAETFGYLKFRLRHSQEEESYITKEEASRIFALAGGNFAKTNHEMRKMTPGSSPEATIPLVPEASDDKKGRIRKVRKPKPKTIKKRKKKTSPRWWERSEYLFGIGILVTAIILIVILLNREDHTVPIDPVDTKKQKVAEDKIDQPLESQGVPPDKEGEQEQVAKKQDQMVSAPQEQTVVPTETENTKPEKNLKTEPLSNTIETQPFIVISSESSRLIHEKTASQKASSDTLVNVSVDRLFNQRVAAASKWLLDFESSLYTVQLMVLTAEDAEKNVKKELMRQDYRSIFNKLFILRSQGPPQSVYVFFGEYPNKVAARTARNNLPLFLRKHDPYITSIREAVEKAGAKR